MAVANHKLHEARLRVARAMTRLSDITQAIEDSRMREAQVEELFTEDSQLVVDIELEREFRTQDDDLKKMLARYASDAELRASMIPWMVYFEGAAVPAWTTEQRMPTEAELDSSAMALYDEVARDVRIWVERQGFKITDSGAGSAGWHLGVPCTDTEADLICRLAHEELAKPLEAKILSVAVKFWGWHFAELHNAEDAKNFIAKYSVS